MPLNPENSKNTKKTQNPPSRVGPRKQEKWPKDDHLCFYLCVFFGFSGPNPVWGICFSYLFAFLGFRGLCSVPGLRDRKSKVNQTVSLDILDSFRA